MHEDEISLIYRDNHASYRNSEGNKYCPKCNQWLNPNNFYRHKGTSDNLDSICKECFKIRRRTNKYKNTDRKYSYKRKNGYKYIPLISNIFNEVGISNHGHHINDSLVIFLPSRIHSSYNNGIDKITHRKRLEPIIESIYSINLNGLLTGEW